MNKQLALGIAFFFAIGAMERLNAQEGAGERSAQVRIGSVRAIPRTKATLFAVLDVELKGRRLLGGRESKTKRRLLG